MVKRLMNSLVLMPQNHSSLVHLVYIKPGGVPGIFPADER